MSVSSFKSSNYFKQGIFFNVSLVRPYFWVITLMMEAASTSETSVNFYPTTLRYNPKYAHLHARRDNLKSYYIHVDQKLRKNTQLGLGKVKLLFLTTMWLGHSTNECYVTNLYEHLLTYSMLVSRLCVFLIDLIYSYFLLIKNVEF
jgi:hypothetical protein